MRLQTVLIWVVVAGLLAGVVAWTRSGGVGPARSDAPTTWTIPIDPARVERLVQGVDGRETSVTRAEADTWMIRWSDAEARPQVWKADPGRVRAALRLLSTAAIVVADEELDIKPTDTIEATERDGRSVEIWFGQRAAGGQTPVVVLVKDTDGIAQKRVDGRIGSGVPDAFVRADWSIWRDPTLFDATAATADALTIRTAADGVRLERGPRGWSITEPFRLDAETGEIERAIGVLRTLQASSFEADPPEDAVTGLDEPIATVRLDSRTGTRMMEVGGQADSGRGLLFARVAAGETAATVRLDAQSLSGISAAPAAYARRVPLNMNPGDIGRVRFLGKDGRPRLDATRSGGEWLTGSEPVAPAQRDAIDRLVRVLTAEPAAQINISQPGAESATVGELGTVECLTRDGVPVASLRLRTAQGTGGMRLLIAMDLSNGAEIVWTAATEQASAVVAWAALMASGG